MDNNKPILNTRPNTAQLKAGKPIAFGLTANRDAYGHILCSKSGSLWYSPSGDELDMAERAFGK